MIDVVAITQQQKTQSQTTVVDLQPQVSISVKHSSHEITIIVTILLIIKKSKKVNEVDIGITY